MGKNGPNWASQHLSIFGRCTLPPLVWDYDILATSRRWKTPLLEQKAETLVLDDLGLNSGLCFWQDYTLSNFLIWAQFLHLQNGHNDEAHLTSSQGMTGAKSKAPARCQMQGLCSKGRSCLFLPFPCSHAGQSFIFETTHSAPNTKRWEPCVFFTSII